MKLQNLGGFATLRVSQEELGLLLLEALSVIVAEKHKCHWKVGQPMAIRGKKREIEAVQLALAPELTPDQLSGIASVIRLTTDPVRDPLTNSYDFWPTPKGARRYVEGGVARAFKNQRASGATEVRDMLDRRNRAKWHIVDNTQLVTWVYRSVAQLRHGYVAKTLASIGEGELPEPDAQVYTADAVEDLGWCLRGEVGVAKRLGSNEQLGTALINLGNQIQESPTLLLEHGTLLGAVQYEQEKRQRFWGSRFAAMHAQYGDRLPATERAMEQNLSALLEIERTLDS